MKQKIAQRATRIGQWVLAVSLFSCLPIHASGIELARNRHTSYTIVRPADAIPSEVYAAEELAGYLGQITGATFRIETDTQAVKGPRIYVALCRESSPVPGIDPERLGQEEFVIRTVGHDLFLVGGRPRGTLYAVYHFLDNVLGVRWWAPGETFVPHRPTLRLQTLSIKKKPVFEYRDVFYHGAMDPDWAARNRCNGRVRSAGSLVAVAPDDKHGSGVIWDPISVHSFAYYLPSAQYFESHPEWFAEVDGKRKGGYNQLCLSNPEVLDIVAEKAKGLLRANPKINIISVSQNDNGVGYCRCPVCKKIDDKEGSPSGSLLRFVNAVAERLESEFPNVLVETLAYQYSRKPPKHVRPRKNVVIRYCTIEATYSRPLTDPVNHLLANDLHEWSLVTDRIYVWDYVANLTNYARPHPNLKHLGPNLRFFAGNHVTGMFAQGVNDSPISEFAELRSWVLSRLMWDPSLDDRALIREFVKGYYGPAAPHILAYIDEISRVSNTGAYTLNWVGGVDDPWATLESMSKFDALLQKAISAASGNPEILNRVRRAYLPLQYMWLAQYDNWQEEAKTKQRPLPHTFDSVFADFERQARSDKFENAGWGKVSDFLGMVRDRSVLASKWYTWPSMAFDGSADVGWNAGDYAPQWIQKDMGKIGVVKGIYTDFSNSYNQVIYRIETSLDGESWKTAISDKTVTNGKGDDMLPQPVEARFVKTTILRADQDGSPMWAGIAEQHIDWE